MIGPAHDADITIMCILERLKITTDTLHNIQKILESERGYKALEEAAIDLKKYEVSTNDWINHLVPMLEQLSTIPDLSDFDCGTYVFKCPICGGNEVRMRISCEADVTLSNFAVYPGNYVCHGSTAWDKTDLHTDDMRIFHYYCTNCLYEWKDTTALLNANAITKKKD